jgi:hypothetical protein
MTNILNGIFKDRDTCIKYLSLLSTEELEKINKDSYRGDNPDKYDLIQSIIDLKLSTPAASRSNSSNMESKGGWKYSHKILAMLVCIFFASFFIPRKGIGDPQYIVFMGIVGLYPLVGICRGFFSIFKKGFSLFTFKTKILVLILSAVLLSIFAIGLVPFLIIAYQELYIQMICHGGACAQGGMGLIFFLPAPWLSFLVVRFVNFCFSSLWPFVLNPDFSLFSFAPSSQDQIAVPKMEK